MGIRFRKSFKVAPGVRVNVGKKSVGVSVGGRAGHVSVNSNGRKTVGASIPRTGISYSESLGGSSGNQRSSDPENDVNEGSISGGGGEPPHNSRSGGVITWILRFLLLVLFACGLYWIYAIYWFFKRRGENKKKDIAVYVLGVISLLYLASGLGGDSDTADTAPDTEVTVTSTPEATPDPTAEPTPTSTPDPTVEPTPTTTPESLPEPNTSEMVDYIYYQAKNDVGGGVNDAKRDEAVEYIRANYPNYYTDNEAMEKTMYYGYWLEEAYEGNGASDPYAVLGMNTYQAVKYVYRGAEGVDAQSTQENLNQIADDLAALGISVSTPETSAQPDVSSDSGNSVPAATATPTPQEEMVWVDDTAARYHKKSDCSGMDAAYQVSKSEAEAMGKTPCGRCYR